MTSALQEDSINTNYKLFMFMRRMGLAVLNLAPSLQTSFIQTTNLSRSSNPKPRVICYQEAEEEEAPEEDSAGVSSRVWRSWCVGGQSGSRV